MKTTGLMIGDWVFNKHHKKHIQITPYDFFNHAHLPSGKQYFVGEPEVVSGRDFEPITLTPEILEKNGFKLNPQGAYSNGRHTSISVIRDGRYFANINTETDDPSFLYQCGRYVHEFQHALRLCGLNDLADNLKLEE